jgi:hypothetical protein
MDKNKRAQISQAFTYIAVILVIGAIAILGARAIMSMFSANCEAKSSDFERKMFSFVDQYSDLGTVKTDSVSVPCDAVEVCMISASAMTPVFTDSDPVIDESVREGSYNVFVKGEFTTPVAKLDKIRTDGDSLKCFKVQNGAARLKFSGEGRTTLVEQG